MNTDLSVGNIRDVLHQIYSNVSTHHILLKYARKRLIIGFKHYNCKH